MCVHCSLCKQRCRPKSTTTNGWWHFGQSEQHKSDFFSYPVRKRSRFWLFCMWFVICVWFVKRDFTLKAAMLMCLWMKLDLYEHFFFNWWLSLNDTPAARGVSFFLTKDQIELPMLNCRLGLKGFCFSSDNIFWNSCIHVTGHYWFHVKNY